MVQHEWLEASTPVAAFSENPSYFESVGSEYHAEGWSGYPEATGVHDGAVTDPLDPGAVRVAGENHPARRRVNAGESIELAGVGPPEPTDGDEFPRLCQGAERGGRTAEVAQGLALGLRRLAAGFEQCREGVSFRGRQSFHHFAVSSANDSSGVRPWGE